MFVGVPKEIKADEYRVAITPAIVGELTGLGQQVGVEAHAGEGAGITDEDYRAAGAEIVADADTIFRRADLIVKVKEPLAVERRKLRRGQTIFTYLHLAPDRAQTIELIASGATAIAYETVTDDAGRLPLLAPMSKVAGRMAPQVAAHFLQRPHGGRGILLSGGEGLPAAEMVVLGGGDVGANAIAIAIGMGANVTAAVRSDATMRALTRRFGERIRCVHSEPAAIAELCRTADVLVGAALIAGAAAPALVSAQMVSQMKHGAVIVDVAIDQGGCVATSRPTTHSQPTFVVDGVVHYCVANMPGAVPRTSTFALTQATRPFILALATKGALPALHADAHLRNGLNVHEGRLTCRPVAEALGLSYTTPEEALG
ncbi:MAG: alanine dehydrogenase [Variibacter sp.]|nr:alanine dehydrogenase [Variibacter sp.]